MGDCRPVAGVRLATVLVVMDKNVHGRFETMTHTDSIASDLLAWRVYVGKRCNIGRQVSSKLSGSNGRLCRASREKLPLINGGRANVGSCM